MTAFIGLDFGADAANANACLTADGGRVSSNAYEELTALHEHAGWSAPDAPNYWPNACRLIRRCLADANVPPAEIKGAAVSCAPPDAVAVGALPDFSMAKMRAEYIEPIALNPHVHEWCGDDFIGYQSVDENLRGDFSRLTELRRHSQPERCTGC